METLISAVSKVYVSPYLPTMKLVQVKFPKSKKKRIRKKWSKQRKNFTHISCEDEIYKLADNSFMVSPRIYQMIKDKTK
jgi:hypothetical protein